MPKACIITLGCPKNTVEGEKMAGALDNSGWALTTDLSDCDAAVIHTCSFIKDAKKESEEAIRAVSRLKKQGGALRLVVTGCMAQELGRKLFKSFPGVDGVIGTGSLDMLVPVLNGERSEALGKPGGLLESAYPRLLSSNGPSAYLRIAEGCGHKCSFCVIPSLRGPYRSRRPGDVASECASLAANGIKEAVLIAQDTTLYGSDLRPKRTLAGLLGRLSKVRGIEWLRILYAYPDTVTDGLLRVIKENRKVCKYLDIPLQHASGRVLRKMRRGTGVRKLLERVKGSVPEIALRTSFITGYPGETEADHGELLALVEEGWFDHMGVFEYSPAKGCGRDSVPARVKAARRRELMLAQKKVVAAKARSLIGRRLRVLVENYDPLKGLYAGRAEFQAPEIDGIVNFNAKMVRGAFADVEITGASGYDLLGKTV